MKFLKVFLMVLAVTVLGIGFAFAGDVCMGDSGKLALQLVDVDKYFRALGIMAMLLVGFGFLMVFVKKYGRSAITATYLLVSIAIPFYFLMDANGVLSHSAIDIDRLILAEFAAASLLITAGAVLGRLRLYQYLILGALFVPCYAFNEWLLLNGGLNLIAKGTFIDTGGSIVIHMFGALFGIGAIMSLTTKKDFAEPIEVNPTSDRFSLLGSMVLWIFWPSFCSALVEPALVPQTVINVILALCGSTLATYFASLALRKKVSITDIANATLAGGVAIGSICDKANFTTAFVVGILAGALSTYGFAVLQSKFQNLIKKVDTCGVLYLHGLPGLLGGLTALYAIKGISFHSQLSGIGIALVLALFTGFVAGKLISFTGKLRTPYDDVDELLE